MYKTILVSTLFSLLLFSQCKKQSGLSESNPDSMTVVKSGTPLSDSKSDIATDYSTAEAQYESLCASCHGRKMVAFVDRRWQYGNSKSDLTNSIKIGIPRVGMPSYGPSMSDAEIEHLVDYILVGIADRESYDIDKAKTPKYYKSSDYVLQIDTVVQGLGIPWGIKVTSNGTMYYTERKGSFSMKKLGEDPVKIEGVPEVKYGRQGGLMDVALHPDFEENQMIYLSYSKPQSGKSTTAVARGKLVDNRLEDLEDVFVAEPYVNTIYHYGSRMIFDNDGYLYVTVGDRGKRDEHPQFLSNACGKVHRLHDDGRIPDDNPFYDDPDAIKSIWSYGHRNQQGMVYIPSKNEIWTNEHGPRGGDELNRISKGVNYGWPTISYGLNYNGTTFTDITEKENMAQPVNTWIPSIAPSGMAAVSGDSYPKWNGDLLSGSLRFNYISRVKVANGEMVEEERILRDIGRVRAIEMGEDGYLYIAVEDPGRILRLTILDAAYSQSSAEKMIDVSDLIGCWTHSYEEEAGEQNRKFRPCDYKDFPKSRFRRKVSLMEGGKCQYLSLSPDDKHFMADGTWSLSDKNIMTVTAEDGTEAFSWRVMDIADDLVRFRR